ncbi:MAG: ATP-binding cassette domain-containing protein [Aquabacterium sp.]
MALLTVDNLVMQFGDKLIQKEVSFQVEAGTIFAIMGGSGCGKSTLLKHLIGLIEPAGGRIVYGDTDYWASATDARAQVRKDFGVLFQSAALWSSMSVLDNVLLPLEQQTDSQRAEREDRARETLSWVGMADYVDYRPADLSGGMKKRVGLARAIVAQPKLLFLDEPSAGLDPISAKRLDDLILSIRERTGAAILVVTHELESIFTIADDSIFLDAESKQPIAHGKPSELRDSASHPTVQAFLHRQDVATA